MATQISNIYVQNEVVWRGHIYFFETIQSVSGVDGNAKFDNEFIFVLARYHKLLIYILLST